MEREFHKIKGLPNSAMKIIASSPEEHQQDLTALVGEIPPNHYLDTRVGVEVINPVRPGQPKIIRPYVMVGLAKIGERLQLETENGKPTPQKQPVSVEIPLAVKQQDGEDEEKYLARLEVMAARNGVTVTDKWRKRSIQLKQADVATQLIKQNAG